MRRNLLPMLLLLAACGREAPAPVEAVSYRNRALPIASTLRGGPADLAGDWVISESYPGLPFAARGTRVAVALGTDGAALWRFAGPGGVEEVVTETGLPGRFAPRREGEPELWILWVDDDFRTAVVGTPDGRFGWIMDRPGAASPDRTRAAREVLDFNGYDVARLAGG